jgi:23S rRNA pseudouridine1911/1915/1917 synthase
VDQEQTTIIVSQEQESLRLDSLLARHFERFSRTYFQYLIDEGAVLVNGSPAKKSTKVVSGDEIEVQFILTQEIVLEPEDIPLNIIYEDEHLLAINKPVGLVVHPAPGNWKSTFVNALLFHCKTLDRDSSLRPGIIHRLDKDTSGVLIAAKTALVHGAMTTLFASRQVEKRYLAICLGKPACTLIDQPLGRHPVRRKEMAVIETGRPARTRLSVVATKGDLSLLDIVLETGRTHQIRVHLAHIGHPILGDVLYGNERINRKYNANRQLLHAASLSFIHPITKALVTISADVPEDMRFIQ